MARLRGQNGSVKDRIALSNANGADNPVAEAPELPVEASPQVAKAHADTKKDDAEPATVEAISPAQGKPADAPADAEFIEPVTEKPEGDETKPSAGAADNGKPPDADPPQEVSIAPPAENDETVTRSRSGSCVSFSPDTSTESKTRKPKAKRKENVKSVAKREARLKETLAAQRAAPAGEAAATNEPASITVSNPPDLVADQVDEHKGTSAKTIRPVEDHATAPEKNDVALDNTKPEEAVVAAKPMDEPSWKFPSLEESNHEAVDEDDAPPGHAVTDLPEEEDAWPSEEQEPQQNTDWPDVGQEDDVDAPDDDTASEEPHAASEEAEPPDDDPAVDQSVEDTTLPEDDLPDESTADAIDAVTEVEPETQAADEDKEERLIDLSDADATTPKPAVLADDASSKSVMNRSEETLIERSGIEETPAEVSQDPEAGTEYASEATKDAINAEPPTAVESPPPKPKRSVRHLKVSPIANDATEEGWIRSSRKPKSAPEAPNYAHLKNSSSTRTAIQVAAVAAEATGPLKEVTKKGWVREARQKHASDASDDADEEEDDDVAIRIVKPSTTRSSHKRTDSGVGSSRHGTSKSSDDRRSADQRHRSSRRSPTSESVFEAPASSQHEEKEERRHHKHCHHKSHHSRDIEPLSRQSSPEDADEPIKLRQDNSSRRHHRKKNSLDDDRHSTSAKSEGSAGRRRRDSKTSTDEKKSLTQRLVTGIARSFNPEHPIRFKTDTGSSRKGS